MRGWSQKDGIVLVSEIEREVDSQEREDFMVVSGCETLRAKWVDQRSAVLRVSSSPYPEDLKRLER